MKFRTKLTLCILCLLAVLFGTGSTVLMTVTFQDSLEQERVSAVGVYQTVLDALRIANDFSVQPGSGDVESILEQLARGTGVSWSSIRLSAGEEVVYTWGDQASSFTGPGEALDASHCVVTSLPAQDGYFLQVSGLLDVSGTEMRLDIAYDCTRAYAMRERREENYRAIFLFMLAAGTALSYLVSWLLTHPLTQLAQTAQRIADGDLSCRTGLHSRDELGLVSARFDEMAERVEANVTELKEAIQRQERFMGNFSHELKNPMTAIIGYADLIRRGDLSQEELAAAADYIFSESKRLERMSLKMMDLLAADAKSVKLSPVSPARLVEEVTRQWRLPLQEEDIDLSCDCEEGECLLEPDLVRSLLINLLDNARKAVSGGAQIRITGVMTPDGCQLSVSDNGCGIPEEAIPHLTETFYRVDKSRARTMGGAGLGLSWCKKIALLHQGDISFASKPGQGTCVTVTLRGGRT